MKKSLYIAILVIAILLNFHQIFFSIFAYSDSYDFLLNAGDKYFFGRWIQSGRPLFGIGAQWIFTNLDISDLVWVRSFSLIGTTAFAVMLFQISAKYYGNLIALFIALAAAVCPSMTIATLWTSTFQLSWSLSLSLFSGWFLLEKANKGFKVWHFVLVLILSLISLNLYQPGYTAFIIPMVLAFLNKTFSYKRLGIMLSTHLVIYILYFVMFKFTLSYYDIIPETRSGLNLNILSSIKWLFKHPFKQASFLNFLFAPRWILTILTLISCVSILVTGVFYYDKIRGGIIYFFLGIISIFVLSILPNFLVVDHFVSYRMLATLIVVLIILIAHTIKKIKSKNIQYSIITSLLLASIFGGYFIANHMFINVQKKEYQLADQFINSLDKQVKKLYIKPSNHQFLVQIDYLRRTSTDEFGLLSNSIPWVPKPFFQLLLNKYDLDIEVKVLGANNTPDLNENSVLFDCEKEWENNGN